jgi:DNA-binding response OmpR family regulator
MGETFDVLSNIEEMDHLPECSGGVRSGMLANDADSFPTVLVVEDNQLLRATVLGVLRGSGFEVREAATVSEARRLLAGRPAINILFDDIRLPDGSGFELATWCRGVRHHVWILLTSAWYHSPSAASEFSVLQKPYSSATLLALLEQLSSRRGARLQPINVSASGALQGVNFGDAKCARSHGRKEQSA